MRLIYFFKFSSPIFQIFCPEVTLICDQVMINVAAYDPKSKSRRLGLGETGWSDPSGSCLAISAHLS